MEVIVDGGKDFEFDKPPRDLISVVAAVDAHLHSRGRAIQALRVDGREILAENLQMEGDTPCSAMGTVEFESDDVGTLVNQSLSELEQVLPELPQACHSLAEVFQGERPEDALEPFQQLALAWGDIKAREMRIVRALNLSVESLEIGGQGFLDIHDDLNKCLQEAADALERNDSVTLGDLLEYELAPRAEKEALIVAQLRKRAEQASG